jgi:glutamate racemase
VLAAVRRRLPGAALAYCADTAGFPYGTKAEPQVAARVAGLIGRLAERLQPALTVIACNTASTIALGWLRPVIACPIVGTVPAIKPAAERSQSRVIGVLGTEATVRQPYVADLTARFAADCTVLLHGSSALVEAAEAKLRGMAVDPGVPAAALAGLLDQPGGDALDTVVLACTHFPLLEAELATAAPRPLALIDGAEGIARRVMTLLGGSTPAPGPGRFLATSPLAPLAPLAPALQEHGLMTMEQLEGPEAGRWA